jgi:quinoprotein glucose dehydrogenase
MVGLEAPWAVTFLPSGAALLTERPGRIRRWSPEEGLAPEPWAVVEGLASDEVGLMGLVSRAHSDGRIEVYVAAVVDHTGGPWVISRAKGVVRRIARLITPEGGQPRSLQVLRYRVSQGDDSAGNPTSLLRVTPAGDLHGGGALSIGPDDLLYLTNGDGTYPARALDPLSAAGKVLRFTLDGEAAPLHPNDPIPAVISGIRNSQGLGWHPTTRELILLDHGPSGMAQEAGRVGNDELNVASFGDNLGWPIVAGASRGGGLVGATVEWTTGIAPAGLAVGSTPDGPWGRAVFVTGLKDGKLRRLAFDPENPSRFQCQEPILEGGFGRLRMVAVAPDGSLWIGTSNRDGRGGPREGDDLILRVRPGRNVASGAVE